jgi:hypothetical protein
MNRRGCSNINSYSTNSTTSTKKTVTVDIILDLLDYTIPRLEFWFTHLAEAPHRWTSNLTAVRCHSITTKSQFRIINNMPASYERRAASNGRNNQQSMADLKIRRLNELNLRLREDLDRPRVTVSQASKESVPASSMPVATWRPAFYDLGS